MYKKGNWYKYLYNYNIQSPKWYRCAHEESKAIGIKYTPGGNMPVTLLGFRATIDKKNWEINKRKKNLRIRVEVPF